MVALRLVSIREGALRPPGADSPGRAIYCRPPAAWPVARDEPRYTPFMASPQTTPPSDGAQAETLLLATVDRLRNEVDGLRHAMRSRAVIEQAKGMFMERYGCTDDEAFTRLSRFSQQTNLKLADVAFALVSSGRPEGPEHPEPADSEATAPSPRQIRAAARRRKDHRLGHRATGDPLLADRVRDRGRWVRLRSELLSAGSGHEVVDAVRGAIDIWPPSTVVLAAVDMSGALVLLGHHGVPAAVAVRWHRLPLDLPLPVCEVARTGQGAWWDGSTPHRPEGLGFGIPDAWALATVLALRRHDRVVGVLALTWPHDGPRPLPGDPALTRLLGDVAEAVQRLATPVLPIRGNRSGTTASRQASDPNAPDPAFALLDVLYDAVLLCGPVTASDRTVTDLRIRHANPAAVRRIGRQLSDLVGRDLLELFPDAAVNGLLAMCLHVWETGELAELHRLPRRQGEPSGPWGEARVSRYRDGVLITWTGREAPESSGGATS